MTPNILIILYILTWKHGKIRRLLNPNPLQAMECITVVPPPAAYKSTNSTPPSLWETGTLASSSQLPPSIHSSCCCATATKQAKSMGSVNSRSTPKCRRTTRSFSAGFSFNTLRIYRKTTWSVSWLIFSGTSTTLISARSRPK